MIKASNAIRTARILLGTPYSEMDCMALIRAVIKRTAGGDKNYRCKGTNWLWKSIGNYGKYKHLTERWESIDGAKPGMLAFKRRGDDVHHVGLVTEAGTVIHSSSAAGCVVETPLDSSWHCLGRHRYIEVDEKVYVDLPEAAPEIHEPVGDTDPKGTTTLINKVDGYTMTISGDWRVAED